LEGYIPVVGKVGVFFVFDGFQEKSFVVNQKLNRAFVALPTFVAGTISVSIRI
jgi:hypothetical protein